MAKKKQTTEVNGTETTVPENTEIVPGTETTVTETTEIVPDTETTVTGVPKTVTDTLPQGVPHDIVVVLLVNGTESAELVQLAIDKWRENFADQNADRLLIIGGKYGDIPSIPFDGANDVDVNLANLLAAIVADDEVPERFILSPVAAFPNLEITEEDLQGLHCLGTALSKQQVICLKNISELAVTQQLKKKGFTDVYNYETGLPVVLEKTKVTELFEEFNPQTYPTKVISLYLNFFNKDVKPVPVDFRNGKYATRIWRRNPDMPVVRRALKESKFLSLKNEGYLAIKKLLE
ncbi:MAG: hypothetical protein LBN27_12275 [Prevotellaceae bacterium]|jgi:hypothetical protein|nr:hypothetical protein [Prevotellaceae bacterium]